VHVCFGPIADINGVRDPFTVRFSLRQELCRIPRIVKLMPPLVGQPMTTERLKDILVAHADR
jgi:hypothetical protein